MYDFGPDPSSEQNKDLNQSLGTAINVRSVDGTSMMHVAFRSHSTMVHLHSSIVPCFYTVLSWPGSKYCTVDLLKRMQEKYKGGKKEIPSEMT